MSRDHMTKSVSRRGALVTLTVAGGVAVAGTAFGSTRPTSRPSRPTARVANGAPVVARATDSAPIDEATRALFAPIQANGRVGDCTIVCVHAVKMGAIPVVLATAGGVRFQVDVLRRDTSAAAINGIRSAGSLTAALHNEGVGDNRTREIEGLGAMALLNALTARESAGVALPALLTLRERTQRFPRGVLSVIV